MRLNHSLLTAGFLLAVAYWVNLSWAGEDDISTKGLAMLKETGSSVWVASKEAPLYAVPNTNDAPIWFDKWMQELPVDQSRMAGAPSGWIPIKGTGKSPAG